MEIFALIVLLVLVASVLAAWAMLGMLPGKIARDRNHPQADAISVCGWCGVGLAQRLVGVVGEPAIQ